MVILAHKYGRLGNRLLITSHFIANALEHKYRLVITNFGDYIQYLDTEEIKRLKTVNISFYDNSIRGEIARFYYQIITSMVYRFNDSRVIRSSSSNRPDYLLDDPMYLSLAKGKTIICEGFTFRDFEGVKKYYPRIKQIFKPKSIYLDRAKSLVASLREKHDIVVAVHIRRSDYKQYENGKYYFDNSVYLKNMHNIHDDLRSVHQSCAFVLCSDEDIDLAEFSTLPITGTNRTVIEDMCVLSECDYIIGPPSTFSQWASFYGETPLGVISNERVLLGVKDCYIVEI